MHLAGQLWSAVYADDFKPGLMRVYRGKEEGKKNNKKKITRNPANKNRILKSSAYYMATKVCDTAELLAGGLALLSQRSGRSYASPKGICKF